MPRNKKKAPLNKTQMIIIVLSTISILLVSGYVIRSAFYTQRFLPNTIVDNVKIDNLTVHEANQKIIRKMMGTPFLIQIDGENWKEINRKDVGWQSNYQKALTNIMKEQNPFVWGIRTVASYDAEGITKNLVDQNKLDEAGNAVLSELGQVNAMRIVSENAKVVQMDQGFKIIPEKQGDTINSSAAVKKFKEAIITGEQTIEFSKYLAKPAISKNSKDLKKKLANMNDVANIKAAYSINGLEIPILTSDINDWLIEDHGKLSLDSEKVTNYLATQNEKYNTKVNPTEFNSTRRGKVSVPAGSYNWEINILEEVPELIKQILTGKDFTRSPIVTGSAAADKPLVDKTYVEVDLQNQHMWYYKEGQVALETDIVSGKPSSPTPSGVDYIWSKETNKVLKGKNEDGSDYASPVQYWMPIDYTGVGIHDSNWQPAYGGDLWKIRGSHGCVNTPPNIAGNLYDMVEVGTPVVIF